MDLSASHIRHQAWNTLGSHGWGTAIITVIVGGIICNAANSILPFLGLIACAPIYFGLSVWFLHYSRDDSTDLNKLFDYYKEFGRVTIALILKGLIIFAWALLLIIPGIIKAYSYSLTYYVMVDNPEMDFSDAMSESRRLMDGHKLEMFVLDLSFIGWILLGLVTLGLAFIFITPYMSMAQAEFYRELIQDRNRTEETDDSRFDSHDQSNIQNNLDQVLGENSL